MRLLGRLLLLLVLVPLAALTAVLGWRGLQDWLGGDLATLERLGTAETSLVYVLGGERWTAFPLAPGSATVRVVTHADLPSDLGAPPDAEWRYAVAYQFTDGGGRPLHEAVRHYRTRKLLLRETETGEVFTASAYVDGNDTPTAGSAAVFSLAGLPGVARVRARVVSASPEIRQVNLRVYQKEPISDRELRPTWDRLAPGQRQALAEGSVYPPALLEERERFDLLRSRWAPVGPSGVEGADYRSRSLFRLRDMEGEPVEPPALPPGLLVDAGHRATLRLPEGGASLVFRVRPLGHRGAGPAGVLEMNWYGQGLGARTSQREAWSAEDPDIGAAFDGGLVELVSDQPVVLQVTTEDGREFPPDPTQLRVFLVDAAGGVTFPVLHLEDEPAAPFRIDLRAAGPAVPGAERRVRYEFLGADGSADGGGEAVLPAVPSPYDRLAGRQGEVVSEPLSLHFALPRDVAAVRLSAPVATLVSGYNRPPDLPRLTRVPEDSFAVGEGGVRQSTWFSVRPEGWKALLAANRSALLTLQERPPEDDPDIAAGRYDWEQFTPEGNWLARDLLVPRAPGPARPAALASIFSRLATGAETVVTVPPSPAGAPPRPELLYVRERGGAAPVRVELDGKPLFEGRMTAARGALALPPLAPGEHRVRATAPPGVGLWLSRVEPLPAALVNRRAIRLAPGATVFPFEKRSPDEELVAAHLFPQGGSGRQVVAVSIEGVERAVGPHAGWTVPTRMFDVRLGPEPPEVRVLGSDQVVGPERVLFLRLGPDLAPGRYRIRVRLDGGPEAYLALTRTTPGLVERREVRRDASRGETALAD